MRTLSLLLISVLPLAAQDGGWALLRGIYPGQVTHVHLMDGKMHGGGFISTTDGEIVVRLRTGDQTFSKGQVKKISVRKGSKRWRNAGIGAAVGAGAIGILVGVAASNNSDLDPLVIGAVVAYGLIGAGIGALFPGYETLYRAPRK